MRQLLSCKVGVDPPFDSRERALLENMSREFAELVSRLTQKKSLIKEATKLALARPERAGEIVDVVMKALLPCKLQTKKTHG